MIDDKDKLIGFRMIYEFDKVSREKHYVIFKIFFFLFTPAV